MASIYEVATEAGVSASTVSRTFNTPHLLNQKTKQRVLEVAQRMNYRPVRMRQQDAAGSTLRQNRTAASAHDLTARGRLPDVLGFHYFSSSGVDTLQENAFYSLVLAGALAEASDIGIRLVLSSSERHEATATLPPIVRDRALSGSLLVGVADQRLLDQFVERIPDIVFVDHHDRSGRYDSIISDNFGGARDAVDHLFHLGHRRIGFVTSDDVVDSFTERLMGYVGAHFDAGILADPGLVMRVAPGEYGAVRERLLRGDRPTAILAANDYHAVELMRVCHEIGVNVPRDLSLIGFDDVQFSAHSIPPLTSVRVPTEQLGRLAVRRLYANILESAESTRMILPVCSLVPVTLVERSSCRRI